MTAVFSTQAMPLWLVCSYAFVVGTVLASFACVVGERVAVRRSLWGRSVCVCGVPVPSWCNVPVLSWLALRGRARCCGASLPSRYVLSETAVGGWFALSAATLAWPALLVVSCALALGVCVAGSWGRAPSSGDACAAERR